MRAADPSPTLHPNFIRVVYHPDWTAGWFRHARLESPGGHEEPGTVRILVVEDEPRLATLLRRGLTEEGHAVDLGGCGEDALAWLDAGDYDAIILDVMLPGIDGLKVCRRIRRARVQTPILLLTARDAVADRVAGLDAGADDYLVKPFAFAELAARLRALARRPSETTGVVLQADAVRLDPAARRVWHGAAPVLPGSRSPRSTRRARMAGAAPGGPAS
jgi:two-component system OmpR family response regulator